MPELPPHYTWGGTRSHQLALASCKGAPLTEKFIWQSLNKQRTHIPVAGICLSNIFKMDAPYKGLAETNICFGGRHLIILTIPIMGKCWLEGMFRKSLCAERMAQVSIKSSVQQKAQPTSIAESLWVVSLQNVSKLHATEENPWQARYRILHNPGLFSDGIWWIICVPVKWRGVYMHADL